VAPAAAQTPPQPQPLPPFVDPALGITVTATRLDEARSSIQPSLGATVYDFSNRVIQNIPQGENAPLNQVLLRAPGVVQDSFGQIHVRGDHGNVQYRLDGVQLPEGLSLFNNILATRYANQMSLLTGALPAQYGLHTAGVVDITVTSASQPPSIAGWAVTAVCPSTVTVGVVVEPVTRTSTSPPLTRSACGLDTAVTAKRSSDA